MIEIIEKAKFQLIQNGITPTWVRVAPETHEVLLFELNRRNGGHAVKIFELCGLKVRIDPECPGLAAYVGGKDEDF